jgi:DNA-binding beta-propeller fold protein YncE
MAHNIHGYKILGIWTGAVLLAGICLLGLNAHPAAQSRMMGAPVFEVDKSWPKPLPNNWILGPVSGIAVDAQDHIWVTHRVASPSIKESGKVAAPDVVEFDAQGNVVQSWNGAGTGYEWMEQVHGITVDSKDRVWISGNGPKDAHLLRFSRAGKFQFQIGHLGKNGGSNDQVNLGHPTQVRLDTATNEIFVSDGEGNQNHRVIVFDADSGAYKRHWGAYGERPDDKAVTRYDPAGPAPKQFGNAVHCVHLAKDGLVYVCDRANDRFQVFRKDGTFVKEVFIARETRERGSLWDIEFSPDQRFMYVADGTNQKVYILPYGQSEVIGSFGGPGKDAGLFATPIHDLVVDSKGNIYTGEAEAAGRVQKFTYKGMGGTR